MDIRVDLMVDFQLPFDSPEHREAALPTYDNQVNFFNSVLFIYDKIVRFRSLSRLRARKERVTEEKIDAQIVMSSGICGRHQASYPGASGPSDSCSSGSPRKPLSCP